MVMGGRGGESDAGDRRPLSLLSSPNRMSMIKCEVSFLGLVP